MLKYSVKFSIKNNSLDKNTPVRMRISFDSARVEIYTGLSAKPSEWDALTGRTAIKNDRRNSELNKIESIIDDIFKNFDVVENRFPTPEELKDAWNQKRNKKLAKDKNPTVLKITEDFIRHNATTRQWTHRRVQSYTAIKNHWEIYAGDKKINDLQEKDLIGWIHYFQTAPLDYKTRKKKSPHRNTTVEKNISDFKFVLKWAARQKIYKGDLHESFEYTFKGTSGDLKEIVYLEWDELLEMYHKDFGSDRLNHVRDVFAFCCFTGQRFSDVKDLKHTDIRDGYFLNTTEKTIDPLRIDLNDYSMEILSRYKDYPNPLPIISHDKTNEYIKELGELMEWNDPVSEVYFVGEKRFSQTYIKKEVISTHAGRRTFVVNALKMNIPSIVVRSWTGHKDERAMKPYTKIVDELKSEHMKKFNAPRNTPVKSDEK